MLIKSMREDPSLVASDRPSPADRRWRPAPLIGATFAAHALGLAAWPLMPQRWSWIAGALAANHMVMLAGALRPRSCLLGPSVSRLPAGDAAAGRVGISFDDGPDPEVTPRVLEILAERRVGGARVGASFFVIGRRAAAHPELITEILRRGHRIENHTYRHPHHFAFLGPRAQAREIDETQDLLEDLTGRRPEWFRAPAGIRNPFLDPLLTWRGLRLASWTRRGFDTVDGRPHRVTRRLVRGLASGDVTLLHDGSAARDGNGRPVVLEVLPRLLDALAERGWQGVPLAD